MICRGCVVVAYEKPIYRVTAIDCMKLHVCGCVVEISSGMACSFLEMTASLTDCKTFHGCLNDSDSATESENTNRSESESEECM